MEATTVETVWQEFHARLYQFILKRVSNPTEAEDILQEVFLKIHRGKDGLKETGRLRAWVYQITRNAIIDHYRSPARQSETPIDNVGAVGSEELTEPTPLDDKDEKATQEIANCLTPMISQLPDPYQEAITLVEVAGMTQPAAAKSLGLSVPGMKARVQRGRKKLKKMLEECCYLEFSRDNKLVEYEIKGNSCNSCSGQDPNSRCGG
jgi:RNA polymerase sigma-70 factor (ECF subfamily)